MRRCCKAPAAGDVDFVREGVRVLAQAVLEAEVSGLAMSHARAAASVRIAR